MTLTLAHLKTYLRETLQNPRRGMRMVLDTRPSMSARVQALVLMAVASALMLHVGFRLSPMPPGNPLIDMMVASPFTTAIAQAVMLWITTVLIQAVGRAWGGQGDFGDAMLAVVWLQAIFVGIQVAQTVALLVLPPLASLISLASLGVFFWLISHFVAEVHGFQSAGKVFLAILATMVALSFLMTFLLAMLLGPGAFANV